jgi:two-component system, OmpR family, response regulator MprA
VLVVDGDPETRAVIATVLKGDGYRVQTASNGVQALREANRHQPRAIVLDTTVPATDGWGFLTRWHARCADRRVPVLVIAPVGQWLKALDLGAQGYLSDPFDLVALETTLARMLSAA